MEPMTELPPPLVDLVSALEQATLMAKQLPLTTDPTHLLQIYSSLNHAHYHLSSFLSKSPNLPPSLPYAAENSLSSATGAADENGTQPMQVGDDREMETEEDSKNSIDRVEERMRDCFIKSKRMKKRPLSPSSVAVAENTRLFEDEIGWVINGYDPRGSKLKALDLIYQFHG